MSRTAALPPVFRDFLDALRRLGARPTIVGGAVRDFFFTGVFPLDFDVEIRLDDGDGGFRHRLCKAYPSLRVQSSPFGILALELPGGIGVELSPPRRDVYEGGGPFGHSDFRAFIDHALDYRGSFARRDLTINALGMLPDGQFVDPFGALDDLQRRRARACSEDFYFDPVRFVRLVRFCLQWDLERDGLLEENLGKFDLSKLTPYYFLKSAFKVPFFRWTGEFFRLVDLHAIAIDRRIGSVRFLGAIDDPGCYGGVVEVLGTLVGKGASRTELDAYCRFAGLSPKLARRR